MKTKSLIQKLLVCLIAGLVCGETFLRVGDRFLSLILPVPVVIGISVLLAAASFIYAFIWQQRDKKGTIDNVKPNAFWIGAIRYGIAFDLAMFGFQKIFRLQFITPLGMLDEPFSSFSSQWLTWSYFGHSYGFACVIGASQILGSMLLVINRTRLLAVIILLPVLLNIIFIDYFYELDFGVLVHALILLAGLLSLLMLDYDRLVDFFLRDRSDRISVRVPKAWIKNAARLSILFIPLLLIAIHGSPDKHPQLKGKYSVSEMMVNGKPMMATTCSDSLLTLVYFDIANECVFEFNSQKRRMFGTYELDENRGDVSTKWHYPPAVSEKGFKGALKRESDHEIELIGQFENDSVKVKLVKQF
jgi:hypothetical protein